jgi:hypothetical protein
MLYIINFLCINGCNLSKNCNFPDLIGKKFSKIKTLLIEEVRKGRSLVYVNIQNLSMYISTHVCTCLAAFVGKICRQHSQRNKILASFFIFIFDIQMPMQQQSTNISICRWKNVQMWFRCYEIIAKLEFM